jgi:hypothetical protein
MTVAHCFSPLIRLGPLCQVSVWITPAVFGPSPSFPTGLSLAITKLSPFGTGVILHCMPGECAFLRKIQNGSCRTEPVILPS